MPRPIRVLAVGSAYLFFSLFGALMGYLFIPVARLGIRDPDARAARAQQTVRGFARGFIRYMRWIGVVRVRYPPMPEVLGEEGPVVVIANHPSLLDVIFIVASFPRLTYVAKASWFKSPFIGPMLRACDHIPGPDGDNPAAGASTLDGMLDRLRKGRSLLVFPEGTRSPRRGLLPFQRGAFEAAMRAEAPLIPCVVWVDPPVLRKDQPWYDVASKIIEYEMRILPTVHPDSFGTSAKALSRRMREVYMQELALTVEAPERETTTNVASSP